MSLKHSPFSSFIRPIHSFKQAYNHGELYFCQILKESAVFSCQNWRFRAKPCPGPNFKDPVTTLVVFMQEAWYILSCFHMICSNLDSPVYCKAYKVWIYHAAIHTNQKVIYGTQALSLESCCGRQRECSRQRETVICNRVSFPTAHIHVSV